MLKLNFVIIFFLIYFNLISSDVFSQDNRIIENYKLEIIQDVLLSDHEIFKPYLLDISENRWIVFFDFARYELVVYNLADNVFQFYGNRGKGPKEFGQIFDLKAGGNDEIFLIDTGNNKMIRWNVEGRFLGEFATGSSSIRPARFTVCKDSNLIYILSSQYSSNGIIHQFEKNGNLRQSFYEPEVKDIRLVYYTDGSLECDQEGNLYYSTLYVNKIRKYSNNGKLVYDMPVYDSSPNEEIVKVDGRLANLNPSATRYSGDIYYMNGKLYVGYSGRARNHFRLIDVYLDSKQEYLHSIQLPFEFQEFVIDEERIIIFREDENGEMYLTIFEYEYEREKTD